MFWVITAKDLAEGAASGVVQFENVSDTLGNVSSDTDIVVRPIYWFIIEDR